MSHELEIRVYDGDKVLASESFDQSKIVIGRILSADFRIPDSRISRIHALLERLDDGSLRITDLASTHGTMVNGERVIERVIGPADSVSIAGLTVQLSYKVIAAGTSPEVSPGAAGFANERAKSPDDVPASSSAAGEQPASPQPMAASSSQRPAVKTNQDPTVIRSLESSAKSRGVTGPTGQPNQELEMTVYWGETVLNVDHCRDRRKTIRIGEGEDNDYVVASHVLPKQFDFVKVKGNQAHIQLHPSMRGSARVNGKLIQLEDSKDSQLLPSIDISGSDIAKIQVGSVHFFFMFVGKPPAIPHDDIIDQGKLFWFLQLLFSGLALATIFFTSLYKSPIEGQVKEFPERFRRVIVKTYQAQAEKKVAGPKKVTGQKTENAQKVTPKAAQGGNQGAGSKAKGPEGTKGTRTATKKAGVSNTRAQTKPKPKQRPKPTERPADSILSTLKNSGIAQKVAQTSGSPSLDKAFQGVGGSEGSSAGSEGKGLQGGARGGSGRTAGAGGLGTEGFSSGASGQGVGAVPGKGEVAVGTESVSVFVQGSISEDEIRRVVNSHQNEVAYCYNQAISLDPSLSGDITINWTIAAGGRVRSARETQNSTGSRSLSECIRRYLGSWRFPSPAQGSTADVSWKWSFKPQGS